MTDAEQLPAGHHVDPTRVARVAERSRFLGARLLSCRASAGPADALPGDWGPRSYSGFEVSLGSTHSSHSAFYILTEFEFASFEEWDVRDREGDPPFDYAEPLVEVSSRLLCTYARIDDEPIDIDDLAHFARAATPRHVWPYWRELAQSMLLRLGTVEVPDSILNEPPLHGPDTQAYQLDMDTDWSKRTRFAEYAEALGVRTDQIFSTRIESGQEWVIFTIDDTSTVHTPTFLGASLYRDDDGVLHEIARMTPGPDIQEATLKDFEDTLRRRTPPEGAK